MRRAAYFAAGLALAIGAQSASANFVITSNKIAGAGPLAGYDIYKLSIANDGTNGTGTDVQAWDVTVTNTSADQGGRQPFWFWNDGSDVTTTGAMIFNQQGLTNGLATIESNGTGVTGQNADNGGNGTFIGVIENNSSSEASTGANKRYTPDRSYHLVGTLQPQPTDVPTYATVKSFRVAASYSFINAGAPNDRLTGTLRFGNIIVPTGNSFTLTGQVLPNAGIQGSAANYNVSFSNNVPDPASLGLIGIAMFAFGRRRRA